MRIVQMPSNKVVCWHWKKRSVEHPLSLKKISPKYNILITPRIEFHVTRPQKFIYLNMIALGLKLYIYGMYLYIVTRAIVVP